MKNSHLAIACLFIVTGLSVAFQDRCIAADPAAENAHREPVVITLRTSVQSESKVIRLGDVANITGGNAALRDQLKQLDLDDCPALGESLVILPPQVEFRLRIAGIDIERISIKGSGVQLTAKSWASVRGADVVTRAASTAPRDEKSRRAVDFSSMSAEEGPLEHEVIQAAKGLVLGKLPWSRDKVDIRVSQSISLEVRQVESAFGYECWAEMRTVGPAVGRVQLRVIAEAPGKPTYDIPVVLEVRHFEDVVMTSKTIERGRVIAANDLYIDRQDVTDLSDYCSSPNELIGSTTRRSIRALMPARLADFEVASRSETSILVKRREQVKMVARVGILNVSATGEALQEGRLGDVIRLRNVESNTNVQGRVSGPGEVEISF